jgi:chemotaxis protein histidine kinase CheA
MRRAIEGTESLKQHVGSIEVETEPGKFTEFKIILPASLVKSGG